MYTHIFTCRHILLIYTCMYLDLIIFKYVFKHIHAQTYHYQPITEYHSPYQYVTQIILHTLYHTIGPIREAACACLSSLLTRPDMETILLSKFFIFSTDILDKWTSKGDEVVSELTVNSFQVIGVLQTIAQIYKKGDRNKLLSHATELLKQCVMISTQLNQVLVRKLTIKLIQRIGMTFLPPRVAMWRYQRGKRSLMDNLENTNTTTNTANTADTSTDNNTVTSINAVGNSDNISDNNNRNNDSNINNDNNNNNQNGDDNDEGEDFEVSAELEDVLDRVLSSLSDKVRFIVLRVLFIVLIMCV